MTATRKITTSRYYIVSALTYRMRSAKGDRMTAEDTLVWMGMSEGYCSVCTGKARAHHFKERPALADVARKWDGMPWYYRLKPDTFKVYLVDRTQTVELEHTEVEV